MGPLAVSRIKGHREVEKRAFWERNPENSQPFPFFTALTPRRERTGAPVARPHWRDKGPICRLPFLPKASAKASQEVFRNGRVRTASLSPAQKASVADEFSGHVKNHRTLAVAYGLAESAGAAEEFQQGEPFAPGSVA